MRVIIQRVSEASVSINGAVKGAIGEGLLILAGFEDADTTEDIDWLAKKIVQLRIFNDSEGIMNLSALNVNAGILLISQFTLHASVKKGNRPSYIKAAKPEIAIPLYEKFITKLEEELGKPIQTGVFGAMMNVSLINNGPVTISIDTKNKE
ncbi:MAG: D-tyrosyl-tRNA(Tyr) deacylase [Bacteroidetes bacterium]|nr:D-tyrosyl-tRNA(Tyr) deacylase [Bacteroidota bacterium]